MAFGVATGWAWW